MNNDNDLDKAPPDLVKLKVVRNTVLSCDFGEVEKTGNSIQSKSI